MQVLNASTSRDIEAAFANIVRDRADALFVAPDGFFNSPTRPICDARDALWDSREPIPIARLSKPAG